MCISGLVVEYIVAIDVTRVRFPADACGLFKTDLVINTVASTNARRMRWCTRNAEPSGKAQLQPDKRELQY